MANSALDVGVPALSNAPAPSAPAVSPADQPVTIIQASSGWRTLDLRDLWLYRELIFFLAWRDVKVRYSRAVFGFLWTVMQPLVAATIFSVVFGRLAKMPSDGLPYPLFAFVGLLPWTYFAKATTNSSNSLVANGNLISKVYFPRLAIPIAGVVSGLVDLGIGFAVLLVLLPFFGIGLTPAVLVTPLLVVLAMVTALAVGIWLSALDVLYQDVRYLIPFLLQIWMFSTPVVYPASLIPEQYRAVYGLNPMAGVVEGFRWALLGAAEPPGVMLAVSASVVLVILLSGLYFFRRMERSFADVV